MPSDITNLPVVPMGGSNQVASPVILVDKTGNYVAAGGGGGGGGLSAADLRSDFSADGTVAADHTSKVILAANTNRKGAMIVNLAAQILYLRYSNDNATKAASATTYWTALAQGEEHLVDAGYKGQIVGTLASGTGNVFWTELV